MLAKFMVKIYSLRIVQLSGLLLGLFFLSTQSIQAANGNDEIAVQLPKKRINAPHFTLPNLSEQPIQLSTYTGKPILLTFWATWCAPCREEMPAMQALWERYKNDGFVILAINIENNNIKQIQKFVREHQLSFPVLLDSDHKIRDLYEIEGLPTSYLIQRDDKFYGKIVGSQPWHKPQAAQLIQSLLK